MILYKLFRFNRFVITKKLYIDIKQDLKKKKLYSLE